MNKRPYRYIYNCDGNNLLIHGERPIAPEDIHRHLDPVLDTSITTMFISCHVGQDMVMRGKTYDLVGDRLTDEEFQRIADPEVSKPNTAELGMVNCRALIDQGMDPLQLVLDRCIERGKETWVTFRPNEVHNVEQPDHFILSSFYREHPEYHIGAPGDPLPDLHLEILGPVHPIVQTWLPGGLDFAEQEVRDYTFAQIEEICQTYPIDGIDIDFQRFPIYFQFGQEEAGIPIMNDFVSTIREMTKCVGTERGRPLQLSVRIMAKPEQNRALGLDPFAWADEGLIDFVTVSHYLRNEFTLPVREYRSLFPDNLPIYASIEYAPDAETYRGLARDLWAEEPDGIMLFNFFAGNPPPYDVIDEIGDRNYLPGGTA
jgi:hypothetical protein